LEVFTRAIKQKKIKGIQTGEEIKLFLFADDIISHVEKKLKNPPKSIELINSVRLQNTKSTYKNQ
jgi:hypothetical protein